ncbi:MAG TPA: hypothetical protein VJ436_12745, partial [Anaerolineales bacterium]|nr:hypothetical protein [Anaerolineales bacterium]
MPSPSTANQRKKSRAAAVIFSLLALSTLLAAYLPGVPFHPDESTLLMMSADFELLWREPLSLAYRPELAGDPQMRYRGIDAPLVRYGIGLGRVLAGMPAPQVDWDWSASWEANRGWGAVPSPGLLFAGRLFTAGLIPLGLVGLYLAARQVTSARGSLAAAFFLGSNALVLLHARLAMAEAPLIFGVAAFLGSLGYSRRFPWLLGLAAALA